MSPLYCWATSKKKKKNLAKTRAIETSANVELFKVVFQAQFLYFFFTFCLLNKDLVSLPISDLGAPMIQKRNILVEIHCLFLLYLWYSSPSLLTETPAVWRSPFVCHNNWAGSAELAAGNKSPSTTFPARWWIRSWVHPWGEVCPSSQKQQETGPETELEMSYSACLKGPCGR